MTQPVSFFPAKPAHLEQKLLYQIIEFGHWRCFDQLLCKYIVRSS